MTFIPAFPTTSLRPFLSFSKEDSAILKGYGILFMIFHHVFSSCVLPAGVDTAWIAPWLTHYASAFKICVAIFLFITGYAMEWKTNSATAFGSLVKAGFLHYFKFWKIYLLCLLLVILVSWAFPTPMLPSATGLDWKDGLLTLTGLQPCYFDWWYMGVFAVASMALYPVCGWITQKASPLLSMTALLGLSLLFQKTAYISGIPCHWQEIARFIPCFIFGYMCAFLATRLLALTSPAAWTAVLLLALEMLSIHLFSFSRAKTMTVLLLFTLWCLPWITRKFQLTTSLTLLGTYSALMWLNH